METMYHVDLNVFCTPDVLRTAAAKLPTQIGGLNSVHTEHVSLSCEPDNMLLNEAQGRPGNLYRVVVHADEPLTTTAVMTCFPDDIPWYGSSGEGEVDPGITAACAWR